MQWKKALALQDDLSVKRESSGSPTKCEKAEEKKQEISHRARFSKRMCFISVARSKENVIDRAEGIKEKYSKLLTADYQKNILKHW